MELLSDSEHERLREIRQLYAGYGLRLNPEYPDIRFLLRYIGELENELWSRDYG